MRTASMVLGIVGGVLAILLAVLFLMSSALIGDLVTEALDDAELTVNGDRFEVLGFDVYAQENSIVVESPSFMFEMKNTGGMVGSMSDAGAQFLGIALIVIASLSAAGGVLAIIGGAFALKKHVAAGVLMLAAAVLSFFTILGIFASLLLIVGGILALIPERKDGRIPPADAPKDTEEKTQAISA